MSDFNSALAILRERVIVMKSFGKRIRFELDDHVMVVDGTQTPPAIIEGAGDGAPNSTIKVSLSDFLGLLNKEIKPWTAFRQGKIRMSGELTAATALQQIF